MSVRNAGKTIREARIKAGLTQEQLSEGGMFCSLSFKNRKWFRRCQSCHISSTYGSCGCSLRSLPDLCKQNRL